MKDKVFISYRRGDTAGYAHMLYDRLEQRLGEARIFFDVDSIDPGTDFVRSIQTALSTCAVMLALIGRRWEPERLQGAEDYVRLEISAALSTGTRIIPVLFDGAEMPQASELPWDLAPLVRRNAVEVRHARFKSDILSLLDLLDKVIEEEVAVSAAEAPEANTTDMAFRRNALAVALAAQATELARDQPDLEDLAALLARRAYLFGQEGQGIALDQVDRALRATLSLPRLFPVPDSLTAVAFSPGGRWLATASRPGEVKIWSLGRQNAVRSLLLGGALREYLLESGGGEVVAITFSPDERWIALLMDTGGVSVHDLGGREIPRSLGGQTWLPTLPLGPPFNRHGSYSYANPLHRVTVPFAFTRDSRALLLGGSDGGLRIWRFEDLQTAPSILGEENPSGSPLRAVAGRPDGDTIVSVDGKGMVREHSLSSPDALPRRVQILGWRGWTSWRNLTQSALVAISADGEMIAEGLNELSGGGMAKVRVWSLRFPNKHLDAEPSLWSEGGVHMESLAFDRQGRFLVITLYPAGSYQGEQLPGGRLLNLEAPRQAPIPFPGDGPVATSADGAKAACNQRLFTLRGAAAVDRLQLPGGDRQVCEVAFTPDGSRIVGIRGTAGIWIWDLRRLDASPTQLGSHDLYHAVHVEHQQPIGVKVKPFKPPFPLAFDGSGSSLIVPVTRGGNVYQPGENLLFWYDLAAGRSWVGASLPRGSVEALRVEGDGSMTEALIRGVELALLRGAGDQLGSELSTVWRSEAPALAVLSPDGKRVALARHWKRDEPGSAAGPELLSVTEEPAEPVQLVSAGHSIEWLGWAPTGERLAAATRRGLFVWDLRHPEDPPLALRGYLDKLWAVAWSPDGTRLAAAARNSVIRLWQISDRTARNPVLLEDPESPVLGLAFSPDGRLLASVNAWGRVRLWIADTGFLADLVCERVGRDLTLEEWRGLIGDELPWEPTCGGSKV